MRSPPISNMYVSSGPAIKRSPWRGVWARTSPSKLDILKLLEFIRSWGELGKQKKQFDKAESRSSRYCAIMIRCSVYE